MLQNRPLPTTFLVPAAVLVAAAAVLCLPLLHSNPLTAAAPLPAVQAAAPATDLLARPLLNPAFSAGFAVAAGGRTCRCSCGYPCKTNADCGPGGICSAGITCCAAPGKGALVAGANGCGPAVPGQRI